ncbi:uncharacterized protein METZ01_LOCUS75731, partial [marine metagenome]
SAPATSTGSSASPRPTSPASEQAPSRRNCSTRSATTWSTSATSTAPTPVVAAGRVGSTPSCSATPHASTRCPNWPSRSSTFSTDSTRSRCAWPTTPTANATISSPTTRRCSTTPSPSTSSCPAGSRTSPVSGRGPNCLPRPRPTSPWSRNRSGCRSAWSASDRVATRSSGSATRA